MIAQHIKGKKWAVFIHGGEFLWSSNIDSGYAILAAQMAEEGTGILAVDYRLGGFAPYPAAINDAIQACELLDQPG
jgi:acetyl esterase/lipase